MKHSVKPNHDILSVGTLQINRKTLNDPIDILENNIETMTNDQDDENVYEIDPVIIMSIFF